MTGAVVRFIVFSSEQRAGVPTTSGHNDLPGCGAAVHYEGLASDIGGGWRGEEDHYSLEVLGVAETVEGNALKHSLFELLDQAATHTGREPAWGYGVDGNAVRGPRGRQITGHGDD